MERHSPSPTAFNLLFLLLDRAQHSRIGQVQWFADLLVDLDPKNNKEREIERERGKELWLNIEKYYRNIC